MTPSPLPSVAYKILTAEQWAGFDETGVFAGAPIDLADGYIHLSAEDQVAGTLERHFAGQTGLVLATIDLAMLGDAVRWRSRTAAPCSRTPTARCRLRR